MGVKDGAIAAKLKLDVERRSERRRICSKRVVASLLLYN